MIESEAFNSIISTLRKSACSHAFIIVGQPDRAGGRVATSVGQYMLCTASKKPCGTCHACILVSKRLHPDLYWIEPEKKSRAISIDRIRDVSRNIFLTSHEGGWKICVVSGADRITIQAGNAFLKTLEEPSKNTLFMLLTENPQALLPTILSRCWYVTLHGDDSDRTDELSDIVAKILNERHEQINENVPVVVTAMECTERILNELKQIKEQIRQTIETSAGGFDEKDDNTLEARIETRYREYRTRLIKWILTWYRDVLVLQWFSNTEIDQIYFKSYIDSLKNTARHLNIVQALHNIEVIETMNRQLEENLAERMVFYWGFQQLQI